MSLCKKTSDQKISEEKRTAVASENVERTIVLLADVVFTDETRIKLTSDGIV